MTRPASPTPVARRGRRRRRCAPGPCGPTGRCRTRRARRSRRRRCRPRRAGVRGSTGTVRRSSRLRTGRSPRPAPAAGGDHAADRRRRAITRYDKPAARRPCGHGVPSRPRWPPASDRLRMEIPRLQTCRRNYRADSHFPIVAACCRWRAEVSYGGAVRALRRVLDVPSSGSSRCCRQWRRQVEPCCGRCPAPQRGGVPSTRARSASTASASTAARRPPSSAMAWCRSPRAARSSPA